MLIFAQFLQMLTHRIQWMNDSYLLELQWSWITPESPKQLALSMPMLERERKKEPGFQRSKPVIYALKALCSHISICFTEIFPLCFSIFSSRELKGGGRSHGPASWADLTMESIRNFFSRPSAWHAKDSEQTSTASGGLVGLNLRSLAYSVKRWNM